MLLMKADVCLLFLIALAIRVHCDQAICADSSPPDSGCIAAKSTQDESSVLRKCCQSDQSYDTKKHTCVVKNETTKFDPSLFDFMSPSASGFDGLVFGIPACSKVLVDFVVTSDSFEKISNKEYVSEMICVDRDAENDSLIGKRCVDVQENCGKFSCVTKCCRPSMHIRGKSCAADGGRGFNPTVYDLADPANPKEMEDGGPDIGIVFDQCPGKKYILKSQFFLVPNGSIVIPEKNRIYTRAGYCLEDIYRPEKKIDGMFAFICIKKENIVGPQEITPRFVLMLIGLIISCLSLAATLLVYSLLPDLQNIHGLTLMCEVASFLLAFLCLLLIHLTFGSKDTNHDYCLVLGYTLYFALLASFTWMNIMSFDIWWTIGGVWGAHSLRGRKRLFWYSLYAWGLPMLLALFAVLVDTYESVNSLPFIVKPAIGTDTCWFPSKMTKSKSELVYYILPMTLAILCNIVLFALTVRSLLQVKKEIKRVQHSTKEDSKRKLDDNRKTFVIACKLFVVMGVSWLAEGISYFHSDRSGPWFYVPDAFNTLRGVIILIIFVCKASVVNALAEKFGCRTARQKGSRTTATMKSRDTSTPPTCFSTEDETNA